MSMGDDQRTDSNGHQSEMEPKEVFQTLKNIQVGNENIILYMEKQNQINQQLMQNLMQMHNKVQQVPTVIGMEGEDSLNKEISDRYRHSNERDVNFQHHSVGSHDGNVNLKFITLNSPKRHQKKREMKMYYKVN